jgi:hypothetical protein
MWVDYGPKRNVLVKLYNAWFQVGDTLYENFDENDPKSVEDFKKMLKTKYDGVETLIMDLIKPEPKFGMHAFEVRTMTCPD